MAAYVVKVEVTRSETYVVNAADPDDALERFWDGDAVEVDGHSETVNMIETEVDVMPELTVHENEDGTIGAIFCPACQGEVYEDGYHNVDNFLDLFETNCCGALIEDPRPIFTAYNRQD